MMILLITEYKKCLAALEREIDKLNTQLTPLKVQVLYSENKENKRKLHLEKFIKDILMKKEKSFGETRWPFRKDIHTSGVKTTPALKGNL